MYGTPRNLTIAGLAFLVAALLAPRVLTISDSFQGILYGAGAGLLFSAVVRMRLPAACDTATPAQRRRYLRELLPAMVLYVIAVLLSTWLLKRVDVVGVRALVALLPVPPVAMAVWAMVRYIRDADELQRRIEVEALAVATAFVCVAYLAAGLLQTAKVIDIPSAVAMIWVFPMVSLVYGLAKVVVSRRYA